MVQWYTTLCPDCGKRIRFFAGPGLGALYPAHMRAKTDTRNEPCPASHMPVVTDSAPEREDAWQQHVREGGD